MYCIIYRHICTYLYKIYICYLKYIYLYMCDYWAAAYDIIVMETLWCILTLWYGFFFLVFWRKPLPWFHMFISTCRNIFNVCGWTSEELSLWWRCSEIIWKEMLQKHNWQWMSHSRCLVKVICYVELCLCEGKEKMTFFSNTVVKTEVKVFSHFFFSFSA